MSIIKTNQLPDEYSQQIIELLTISDQEFVPPLSHRTGTNQQDFIHTTTQENSILEYYNSLKTQPFILIIDNTTQQVQGFLTYKNTSSTEIYITTIIIHPQYRGKGFAKILYEEVDQTKTITVRTWETNHSQHYILQKLGYHNTVTLPNDRYNPLTQEYEDTLYYQKTPQE